LIGIFSAALQEAGPKFSLNRNALRSKPQRLLLTASFAIQIGKRLLKLIKFLAGLAMLSFGRQSFVIAEQLLCLPGQAFDIG